MEVDAPVVITLSDEESEESDLESKINEEKEAGNGFFKSREFQKAIKRYTNAINLAEQSPLVALCYGNRAACYINLKMYDDAMRDLETARLLDNTYNKYFQRMVKCKCMKGDFKGTEDFIAKLPDNLVDSVLNDEINNFKDIFSKFKAAMNHFESKKYRDAAYLFKVIIDKGVNNTDLIAKQAECYALHGDYTKAHEIANSVLASQQMHADAIYIRGYCLYYENEIDKALGEFHVVLKLDPDHMKAKEIYKIAKALKSRKDIGLDAFKSSNFTEAEKIFTECLNIDTKNKLANAQLYCNRAVTFTKLKKHEKALPDFQRALELDPKYYMVYRRRGKCYEEMENYEALVADYEKLYANVKTQDNLILLQKAKIELKKSKRLNYYKILGVTQNATQEEITKAYKSKAKKHHPDRHSSLGQEEQKEQEKLFKQVGEAYSILGDQKKRDTYDRGDSYDDVGMGGPGASWGSGGFPFANFQTGSPMFGGGFTHYQFYQ